MALGTRVVTSRLPPIEEVCGSAAVYVNPLEPVDIARGIEATLDEGAPARRTAIDRGKARAARYAWTQSADVFDQFVLRLWAGMQPTAA